MTSTINAAAQVDDPDSVFAHFQRLIALRHDEPVVAHGTFRMLLPDDEQVYAFVREHDGDRLLVVANLSDAAGVVADLAEAGSLAGAEPLVPRFGPRLDALARRPAGPVGVAGLPTALTGCGQLPRCRRAGARLRNCPQVLRRTPGSGRALARASSSSGESCWSEDQPEMVLA